MIQQKNFMKNNYRKSEIYKQNLNHQNQNSQHQNKVLIPSVEQDEEDKIIDELSKLIAEETLDDTEVKSPAQDS
jgi:hypothetical protein